GVRRDNHCAQRLGAGPRSPAAHLEAAAPRAAWRYPDRQAIRRRYDRRGRPRARGKPCRGRPCAARILRSTLPGKVDLQANWPLLRRSAGVRRYWLTWPNVVTGMPWRVPLWEKEFPGRKLGENREASYQQRSRSKSGHVSSLCGAGADYALRPSTAFVERLLQHESFHIESVTVADETEGHFTQCKGAAI